MPDVFAPARKDVKCADLEASPDLAICVRASALSMSTAMYTKAVKMGHSLTSGRREKSGRRSGAWW